MTIHTPDLQADDIALEQLKTLESLQSVMRATLTEHQRNMKVSVLRGRMAETVMKIHSKTIEGFGEEIKHLLLAYVEKEINVGQNVMDSVETTMDKVSTSLGGFATSVGTLADTLKDMAANQRTVKNVGDDQQKKMINELSQVRDLLNHIRSNTMNTSKEVKNCTWQLSELRSGSVDQKGEVNSQAGSMLYLLDEKLKTATQSVLGALGKYVTSIQESIEKGVHPEKSHKKRVKTQEGEDKERVARQKLEERKRLEEEGPKESLFHPLTGQQLFLTQGQQSEFFKSLHLLQRGDKPMGGLPNPLSGTPPPMMPTPMAPGVSSAPGGAPPPGILPGVVPGMPAPGMPPPTITGRLFSRISSSIWNASVQLMDS